MSKVFENSFWLTVSYFIGFMIPILELPILARALGPESYGTILVFISISLTMSIFVEYGFNLSAAREVSRVREDKEELSMLVGSVFVSKLMIAIVVVFIVCVFFVSSGYDLFLYSELIVPAVLYFIAFGFSPFWFFQGIEKMVKPIFINLILRFLSLFILWLFVSSPSDTKLALYVLALSGLLTTVITTFLMLRHIGSMSFSWSKAILQIRSGWHAFIYRSSNDVMMSISPAIIGFASTTYQVGVFSPAEKLIKATAGVAAPILTAFFPHLSRKSNPSKQGFWLVFYLVVTSIVGAFFLWLLAPWIIITLLGKEFLLSIEIIPIFVFLIPIRVCNQSLGLAILLPQGKDRYAGFSILFCSLLTILIGFVLTTIYGAKGMVYGLIVAELFLLVFLLLGVLKNHE